MPRHYAATTRTAARVSLTCAYCGKVVEVYAHAVHPTAPPACGKSHAMRLRGGRPRTPEADRFWPRVLRDGPQTRWVDTPCWEYRGTHNRGGYAYFGMWFPLDVHPRGGFWRPEGAHRTSYRLAHGIPPDGLPDFYSVQHACNNPGCVNPAHLSLGPPSSNTRYMWDSGRAGPRLPFPKGEAHPYATFTAAMVAQAWELRAAGMTYAGIAAPRPQPRWGGAHPQGSLLARGE